LLDRYAPHLVSLATPIETATLRAALTEIAAKVRDADWSAEWRGSALDASATVAALREALRASALQPAFADLIDALEARLAVSS
jgi:hypothetical protein